MKEDNIDIGIDNSVALNMIENEILLYIVKNEFNNQRNIANDCGISLGAVNKALQNLYKKGYIDNNKKITAKTETIIKNNKPKSAVVLAAGIGMQILSTGTEKSKALLEIENETVIERIIKYLKEVGINKIYVIVGFAKEKFEYLIDEYGVELIINSDYAVKNNLYSINMVLDKLENTYVIPSDIWCKKNPFSKFELLSWYSIKDMEDENSTYRLNRKNEVVKVSAGKGGSSVIGITYINKSDSKKVKRKIEAMVQNMDSEKLFWEDSLFIGNKMFINGKRIDDESAIEINSFEQLDNISENAFNLKEEELEIIAEKLEVNVEDLEDITLSKKGMTNRSYIFKCKNDRYMMRVPGEGTDKLVNRKNEEIVYKTIAKYNISDEIVFIDGNKGYKLTKFVENARNCDIFSDSDLKMCLEKIKSLHDLKLKVDFEYNLFDEIERYEKLWDGEKSIYRDYLTTKENVLSLKEYIDNNVKEKVLCHIDANNDNFLITDDEIRLIDWEYAAMQDPDVDIAMFGIYALYDKEHMDKLIDIYYEYNCPKNIRIKIYCYCAVCGLLWSNWCEYKRNLGVDFGEYSIKQYRYAKEYYRFVQEELKKD